MQASGQLTANSMSAVAKITGLGSALGAAASPAASALSGLAGRSTARIARGAEVKTGAEGVKTAATVPTTGPASFLAILKKAVTEAGAKGAREPELLETEGKTRTSPKRAAAAAKHNEAKTPETAELATSSLAQAAGAPQAVAALATGTTPVATRAVGAPRERAAEKGGGGRETTSPVSATEAASPKVVLVDLRGAERITGESQTAGRTQRKSAAAPEARTTGQESAADKPSAVAAGATPAREVESPTVLTLRPAGGEGSGDRAQSARTLDTGLPSGRFGELLRDEVVRQASLLVRGGGEGEIRLTLKPESLGEVRIRMKVTDDALSGRILVTTSEAREVFRDNLSTLEAALRAQGFQTASLDVAVSDGGRRRPENPTPVAPVGPGVGEEELDRGGRYVILTDAASHAVNLIA